MFGQKPHAIDSRVMSTTYGFDTNHRFDPKLHPMEKKHVVDDVASTSTSTILLRKACTASREGSVYISRLTTTPLIVKIVLFSWLKKMKW